MSTWLTSPVGHAQEWCIQGLGHLQLPRSTLPVRGQKPKTKYLSSLTANAALLNICRVELSDSMAIFRVMSSPKVFTNGHMVAQTRPTSGKLETSNSHPQTHAISQTASTRVADCDPSRARACQMPLRQLSGAL